MGLVDFVICAAIVIWLVQMWKMAIKEVRGWRSR